MKRAIGLLTITLLAAGCGSGSKPQADAAATAPAGKPGLEEARSCIAVHLSQFGWEKVELIAITECPQVPPSAQVTGEAWAYTFTANYSNILGERQVSENWTA